MIDGYSLAAWFGRRLALYFIIAVVGTAIVVTLAAFGIYVITWR